MNNSIEKKSSTIEIIKPWSFKKQGLQQISID